MDNLFTLALEANGGLERWRQFNMVRANASMTNGKCDEAANSY